MMTNCKIELTEEQRLAMCLSLHGKSKLITRAQLNEFVSGCVQAAVDGSSGRVCSTPSSPSASPVSHTLPAPYAERYADRPDTWKAGWLRGWNQVR